MRRFSLNLHIDANPLPLQSFRYTKGGGYKPKRIKAYQELIAWRAKEAMAGHAPVEFPVSVSYTLFRDNKRRVDVDNMAKAISDALTGIVWLDDQQIHELHVYKTYGKPGKIWICVEELRRGA